MSLLSLYFKPKFLVILCFGFSSGLPLVLTSGILSFWLAGVGINKTIIGLFALIGFPYIWKVLWAPVVDNVSIPFLSKWMGQRRSWLLLIQLLLLGAIVIMGYSAPHQNLLLTVLATLSVTILSATQDILIDAYRVESLEDNEYAAGGSAEGLGYRVGTVIVGGIAFSLSDTYSWQKIYALLALCMGIGIITTLWCKEPASTRQLVRKTLTLRKRLRHALIEPFLDFTQKNNWFLILLFILFYRSGESLIGHMSPVFYKEMGFSGEDIGTVAKTLGIWVTMMGSILGGIIAFRIGITNTLFVGSTLHLLSNGFFILLALQKPSLPYLYCAILSENIAGGVIGTGFVAYLSHLCSKKFTATQYALFSSLIALNRIFTQASSGFLADHMEWLTFFLLASSLTLPNIGILLYLRKKTPSP